MAVIFDKTMDVLSRTLDLCLVRHNVVADNIANAETPGFKARRVDFESELQRATELVGPDGGTGRDLASVKPVIFEDPHAEVGQDLNTVDMDREMAELSKNDLKYSALSQAVGKKFALLKYAITEGNER
ncbi:MAG: flagellar basal body rod protein FlgB [Deltaproteobacteria bacterium]|nr:flagellar basal body rod protein FlgB [Deltaproteobacteria bacterium]